MKEIPQWRLHWVLSQVKDVDQKRQIFDPGIFHLCELCCVALGLAAVHVDLQAQG